MSLQRALWSGYFLVTVLALFLGTASATQQQGSSPSYLEQVWSLEGAWTGVAGDESKGAICAISRGGNCVEVGLAGKIQREIKLPAGGGSILRLATLLGDGAKALLTFSLWGEELRAHDLSGKQLWSYPRATGIDDVWASDLNGDGADEVIVGYNGNTGLHVLDSKGRLLWKSAGIGIGNVWSVCAGDVLGGGKPQVVTTSARGAVHVFGSDGRKSKDLDAGIYATMVRIGKLSEKDQAATILVAGPARGRGAGQAPGIFTALSGDGAKRWSLELPAGTPPHVSSAYLAPGKPWLAVGMQYGQVHVVDVDKGRIIASLYDQGMLPEVGWVNSKDAGVPLLLVATGNKLNAFRVAKSE